MWLQSQVFLFQRDALLFKCRSQRFVFKRGQKTDVAQFNILFSAERLPAVNTWQCVWCPTRAKTQLTHIFLVAFGRDLESTNNCPLLKGWIPRLFSCGLMTKIIFPRI